MDLIHIATRRPDNDLDRLLEQRAETAGKIVLLNEHARAIKLALQSHIARRLREGASREQLKRHLAASGMSAGIVQAFLGVSVKLSGDPRPEYMTDPRQRSLELELPRHG